VGTLPRAVNEKIQELKDTKANYPRQMRIKIMTARSRVARNEPPLHLFDAGESVKYWIIKDHRHALKLRSSKGSKIIENLGENFVSPCGKNRFSTFEKHEQ